MKKTLWLLLFMGIFSSHVWSQQKTQEPTKKTNANPVKGQGIKSLLKTINTPASSTNTKKSIAPTQKNTATKKTDTKSVTAKTTEFKPKTETEAVKADSVAADVANQEKESDRPLAVFKKDTTTRYVGTLKMGDDYINSRYTPPTITLLFINDLFDRDKKEMESEDFMADNLEIGDKFYLNQEIIPARKKKEFLEEIHKHSSASLLPRLYSGPVLNKLQKTARWSDTTYSIYKERIAFKADKPIVPKVKLKSGNALAGINSTTNDSLGNAILYALLKNDMPATTMRVWCDPKAVLRRSTEIQTPYDRAADKDPKKKLMYQELWKQNFILVWGFSNVHEIYENVYGKNSKGRDVVIGTKPTGRYACDVRSFLYKIEMNPTTLSDLGSKCDTRRIPVRYAHRFDMQNFSMGAKHYTVNRRKFVNGSFVVVPEEVYLTEKQFNQNAIRSATADIFEELEKVIDEFHMRAGVMQVKPFFASEMGEKQGLYLDQRYDVYRYEGNREKKEVNAIKVATVRMTKIAKNRGGEKPSKQSSSEMGLTSSLSGFSIFKEKPKPQDNSAKASLTNNKEASQKSSPALSGDSLHRWSHFKPITLGSIEKGDFLLQNDDRGITLQMGYNHSSLYPSLMFGAELNINVLLKSSFLPSGFKLGAWVNSITNDYKFTYYDEEAHETKETKIYFSVYLAKDFYLSRIVDISPFVAYELAGESAGVRFGTQIPINVFKGKVKLSPHVSLQTLSQKGESARPCFGVLTKFDF